MKQPSKMWLPSGQLCQWTVNVAAVNRQLTHSDSSTCSPTLNQQCAHTTATSTCLPCGMTQSICLQLKASRDARRDLQGAEARSASSLELHCGPAGSLYVCMVRCVPWGLMKENTLLSKQLASQLGISASDLTFFPEQQ